jgi:hypothetical protein
MTNMGIQGRRVIKEIAESKKKIGIKISPICCFGPILIMLTMCLLVTCVSAQLPTTDWPRCESVCRAGEVTLIEPDPFYMQFDEAQTCTPGGEFSAVLHGKIHFNSDRYCTYVVVDVYSVKNGVETLEAQDLQFWIGGKAAGDYDISIGTITWPCDSSLRVKNIYFQWDQNNNRCSDGSCYYDSTHKWTDPSKCKQYAGTGYEVLLQTITVNKVTSGPCSGTAFPITVDSTTYPITCTNSVSFYTGKGVHTVVEPAVTIPVGWVLTSVTCSGGGSCADTTNGKIVTLAAGDDAVVTFTNTRIYPDLAVTKTASYDCETGIITYTINWENKGDKSQISTKLEDDYDQTKVTPVGSSHDGVDNGDKITWDLGEVLKGAKGIKTFEAALIDKCKIDSVPNVVTIYGTDTDKNPADNTVTISTDVGDTTPPVITGTLPGITVQCIGDVPAAVTTIADLKALGDPDLLITDNCDSDLTLTHADTEPTDPCGGTMTRTYTVTDDCGKATTIDQIITISDTTPPVITGTLPGITVQCIGDVPAAVTTIADLVALGEPDLVITDNCDSDLTLTHADTEPTDPCGGTMTRTYTVTDDCGKATTIDQIIRISDTTPPTITGTLPDVTVQCIGDVPAAVTTIADLVALGDPDLLIADNCDSDLELTHADTPLPTDPCYGTVTRTYTVTDDCGKATTIDQIITISDTTPPVITSCPVEVTVECPTSIPAPTNDWAGFYGAGGRAADNCGSTLTATYSDAPPSGTCPELIIRTWTVKDKCLNPVTCEQKIFRDDTIPPAITTCPPNIQVICSNNIPYPTNDWAGFYGAGGSATDICDSTLTATYSDAPPYTAPNGETIIIRTWRVADDCHFSECPQTITVTNVKLDVQVPDLEYCIVSGSQTLTGTVHNYDPLLDTLLWTIVSGPGKLADPADPDPDNPTLPLNHFSVIFTPTGIPGDLNTVTVVRLTATRGSPCPDSDYDDGNIVVYQIPLVEIHVIKPSA